MQYFVYIHATVEGMKAVEIDRCKQELKQLKGSLSSEQYVISLVFLTAHMK